MPLLSGPASGLSSSGFNAQTSFSLATVKTLRIACVVVLATACCAGKPLAAQTAHAGGVLPIGSGFSSPVGVAVDGSVRFTFDSGGSIGAPVVLTQGATGLDFADARTGTCTTNGASHVYNPGVTCTVDVTFTPKYPGQRLGAVQLVTNGGTVIATAHIYGTGTGPLVTFPGNTTVNTIGSGFNRDYGVAVDGSGNVFVADTFNSAVKEIVASNSTVNTIGSGFNQPNGVAVDGSGNVFVADFGNNAVKEIVAVGGVVSSGSTVYTIGSGFSAPTGVAVDGSGNIFVADYGNSAVKEIAAVGDAVSSSSTVNTIGGASAVPLA